MENANIKGVKSLVNLSKGYFLTTIINQALPFLLIPVLTRYLSTEEYGMLSVFTFYMAVCHAILGAALPTVVAKYFFEWEKEAVSSLIGNCVLLALKYTLILVAVLVLSWPLLGTNWGVSLPFILLIPISSFGLIVFSIGLNVCKNERRVFHFSVHQISNTTLNVLFSLLSVCLFLWGWGGRFCSIGIAYLISAVIMCCYLKKRGYMNLSYSSSLQKEIKKVLHPLIPNSVQMILIAQAGLFFMKIYFGSGILGQYALALQISTCMKLLIDTLNMSWQPYLFEQLSLGESMDKSLVGRCLILLLSLLVVGGIFLNLISEPLMEIMATSEYFSATKYLPSLIIGWLFYGVFVFIQPILIKHEKQRVIGVVSLVSLLVMLLANTILPQLLGEMAISYSFAMVYFVLALPLTIVMLRVSRGGPYN